MLDQPGYKDVLEEFEKKANDMLRSGSPDMSWIKGVQDVFDAFENARPELDKANEALASMPKPEDDPKSKFDADGYPLS